MSIREEVPPSFPFDRPDLGPPKEYAAYRDQPGLRKVRLWNGNTAWLATRYDDVRMLLSDNRFSADPRKPGFPHVAPGRAREKREDLPFFVMMDQPEHTRYRRLLTKEFTVSRIQALRLVVEKITNDLIDELLEGGQPVDAIEHFALPLPTRMIAHMLGVPYEDHEFFQDRTTKILMIDGPPGQTLQAGDDMREYIIHLMKRKAKAPTEYDDIMGRLIVDQLQPGNTTYEEAAMLMVMLLLAGHETTANMTGLGILSMLENPDVFELLRGDNPDETIRRAVEEMLRFHSVVHYTGTRVALEDVEFNGQLIKAGEGILPQILAANFDPEKYETPDKFDVTRETVTPHVAFGFGIHQCLGQPLARMELASVFHILPRRIPTLRLAVPLNELVFKKGLLVHGLKALPVAW